MTIANQRTWASVEFGVGAEHEELAGWVMLESMGAAGCEVITEPESRTVLIRATFDSEQMSSEQFEDIERVLKEHGLEPLNLIQCFIQQEDWLAKWKEGFKPFNSGEELVVCPPWEIENAQRDAGTRKFLVIEPGMAFGTGLHATTRFCLRAIEVESIGTEVLDVGTGSGILAIATALLHPNTKITAIDNDPVASENAQLNCKLNDVESKIELMTATTDHLAGRQFDTILSNITCEDIVALLPQYRDLIRHGGSVICAGVLTEKRHLLEKSAPAHGFAINRVEEDGHWSGLVLKRQ